MTVADTAITSFDSEEVAPQRSNPLYTVSVDEGVHHVIEATRHYIPGLGVAVLAHTYVVHQDIAVDKAFHICAWSLIFTRQTVKSE